MSIREELERLAAEVHGAVAQQDFAAAAERAGFYAERIREVSSQLPAEEAMEFIQQGCNTLKSARRKVCIARALVADRLRRLQRTGGYSPGRGAVVHTWSING